MKRIILAAPAFLSLAICGYAFAQATPANVMVKNGMLEDSKGMALYTFANDKTPEKSACVGNCADTWPPLRPAADARPMGEWTIISRDDGSKQWAYKGKPIYLFKMDTKAGEASGEGRGNGAWQAAKA